MRSEEAGGQLRTEVEGSLRVAQGRPTTGTCPECGSARCPQCGSTDMHMKSGGKGSKAPTPVRYFECGNGHSFKRSQSAKPAPPAAPG